MAVTGDKVRFKCFVTPIEECDEGYKHIHSAVGKRLGGNNTYELTDALQGDQIWYNASLSIDNTAGGVNIISGDYANGASVANNDIVIFIFVKCTSGALTLGLNGTMDQEITVTSGEAVCFRTTITVDDIHVYSQFGATAEVFVVCLDVSA